MAAKTADTFSGAGTIFDSTVSGRAVDAISVICDTGTVVVHADPLHNAGEGITLTSGGAGASVTLRARPGRLTKVTITGTGTGRYVVVEG